MNNYLESNISVEDIAINEQPMEIQHEIIENNQNKNLDLGPTNSRQDDGFKTFPSINIITQEDEFINNSEYCGEFSEFPDEVISDEYDFEYNEDSEMQKALEEVEIEEREPLEDDKEYQCILHNVEAGCTRARGIPTLTFTYKVYDGTSQPKWAHDTLFFSNIKFTLKRAKGMLMKYNFDLTKDYAKDVTTIAEACKYLIGTRAIIKQFTRDCKYQNYEVITTEKTQNI